MQTTEKYYYSSGGTFGLEYTFYKLVKETKTGIRLVCIDKVKVRDLDKFNCIVKPLDIEDSNTFHAKKRTDRNGVCYQHCNTYINEIDNINDEFEERTQVYKDYQMFIN